MSEDKPNKFLMKMTSNIAKALMDDIIILQIWYKYYTS